MDDYFKQFREMISLRGLTDHTIVSYSTYIRVYLDYLSYILHKMPEDVSWAELRGFVRWLQKEKKSLGQDHQSLYFTASFLYPLCPSQTLGRLSAPDAQV